MHTLSESLMNNMRIREIEIVGDEMEELTELLEAGTVTVAQMWDMRSFGRTEVAVPVVSVVSDNDLISF